MRIEAVAIAVVVAVATAAAVESTEKPRPAKNSSQKSKSTIETLLLQATSSEFMAGLLDATIEEFKSRDIIWIHISMASRYA